MRKNSIENYKSMFGDFWFEIPIYYFNFEHSLRFELDGKYGIDEVENILVFFRDLFFDLFGDSETIYLIENYDVTLASRMKHLMNYSLEVDKLFSFSFITRLKEFHDDFEKYCDTDKCICKVYKLKKDDELNIYRIKHLAFSLFCWHFKSGSVDYPPVVFADVDRKIFLDFYGGADGCDVVIKDKEFMKKIYEKHSDWIIDYTREETIKKIYE